MTTWSHAPPGSTGRPCLGPLRDRFAETLEAERERRLLWLPVLLATGIGLYFGLRAEPLPLSGTLAAVSALLLIALAGPEAGRLRALGLILFTVALGFTAAQARTALVDTVMLAEPVHRITLTGRIRDFAGDADAYQLLLDRVSSSDLPADQTPGLIRLNGKGTLDPALRRGQWVRLRGGLFPPPGPPAPQAFDFQRHAFFLGLGAVGYASGPPEPIVGPPPDRWTRLTYGLEDLRSGVHRRILDSAPEGAAGTVMAALMTGNRDAIPPEILAEFRAAGMAHLLAISGLHMTLVAGLIYLLTRRVLALVPALAVAHPIKKWAACAGLLAAVCYVLLVGSPVPTVRSVLMTGLVMTAILVDRNPFTLRTVAFAAFLLLLVRPDSLLGASFQMSFAAVTALIAAFETLEPRWARWRAQVGGPWRWGLYLLALMTSSLVASLATTPFSIFHFNAMANYGPLANMIAVPLTAWWVMPWAVVAFAAMPLGLEPGPLLLMSWGVEGLLALAAFTARQPGAVTDLAAFPLSALVILTLGALWLCLWRGRWRLWGLAGVAAGLWLAITAPLPIAFVHGDGATLAVRLSDGRLAVSNSARNDFAVGVWGNRVAAPESVDWPESGFLDHGRLGCDPLGCAFRPRPDLLIAFPRTPDGQIADCPEAAAALQPFAALPCPAAIPLGPTALAHEGAHSLTLTRDGLAVLSARAWRGDRPWTVP